MGRSDMDCIYCGAPLPEGARLCSRCGRLLSPTRREPEEERAEQERREEENAGTSAGSTGRMLPSNVDRWSGTEASVDRGSLPFPLLVSPPEPTVSGSYGHAWEQLRRHFWPLLLVGIVTFVILALGEVLGSAAREASGEGAEGVVSVLFQLLVGLPLSFGSAYAYLRAARGERPQVSDLFLPFRRAYLTAILAGLLATVLVLVGLILLIIPGIVVAVRLSFVQFLLLDEGLGPVEMIRESWERTSGYGWTIFFISLLSIPIVLLGVLLLIVGIVPAVMLIELAYASLFVGVVAERYGRW